MSLNFLNSLITSFRNGFHSFTFGNEISHVLERKVIHLLTRGFVGINELSVALEIGWEWSGIGFDCINMKWEQSFKTLLDSHSVSDLLLESKVVFLRWIRDYQVVEVMKFDIS